VAGNEVFDRASQLYYVALTSSTGQACASNLAYWAETDSSYTADDYGATTAYVRGNQVYYPTTDKYYQLYAATSTGNLPTDATKWGELPAFRRIIDYDQAWETNGLGDVLAVWDHDFVETDSGILVMSDEVQVWVEFRKRVSDFSGADFVLGTVYTAGTQVYYSTTGDYYLCSANTAGTELPTDSGHWTRVDFPEVLGRPVAQAAATDVVAKTQGERAAKPMEDAEFLELLAEEFLRRDPASRKNLSNQLNVR
jgi:hypothetical protein